MNKIISEGLTFDDVLIKPKYSELNSRKDANLRTLIGCYNLNIPILSANMDTVTGPYMAVAMWKTGAIGILHRFMSIKDNVYDVKEVRHNGGECGVSVGLGPDELARASALYHEADSRLIVLDVAHGAQKQVADQYMKLREICPGASFIVGNFATQESICDFILDGCGFDHVSHFPDIFKIGIGPGSACTTRMKTGVGNPQLTALLECTKIDIKYIADGGMKTSGDIAKALAAGACGVMLGGMLAGTDESPGQKIPDRFQSMTFGYEHLPESERRYYKKYRGSASKESYDAQGKDQAYITAEGESFTVLYKGQVSEVLQDIEGGLRSAFSYVGAKDLKEFQEKAQFVRVTPSTVVENTSHGKKVSDR